MLSEHLARTPIIRGEGTATAPAGVPGFDFVDANVDPELAMTLKLSLETEEAERKARQTANPSGEKKEGSSAPATAPQGDVNMEDDPELAEAIRQSMIDMAQPEPEKDDEDEFRMALEMSHQTAEVDRENDQKTALLQKETQATPDKPQEQPNPDVDPDYISQVFLGLPDIDPNDPDVKDLLESMRKQNQTEDKK